MLHLTGFCVVAHDFQAGPFVSRRWWRRPKFWCLAIMASGILFVAIFFVLWGIAIANQEDHYGFVTISEDKTHFELDGRPFRWSGEQDLLPHVLGSHRGPGNHCVHYRRLNGRLLRRLEYP